MWVRDHSNAPCYWNRPEKTEQTMRDGGWIWTGDRLVEDSDGFFTFVGRVDDLIKVSGQCGFTRSRSSSACPNTRRFASVRSSE
jgi:acyl-coenzyme A synthetase/AMP-(fatty) acid ligase